MLFPRTHLTFLSLFSALLCAVCQGNELGAGKIDHANQPLAVTPPRGWNSYNSYSWIISEELFLQNAQQVAEKLLPYGYEYVVIDFLWYRSLHADASVSSPGFDVIDEWGRPIPDPVRWPSTAGGKGFKPIADQVHAMGLKFGIHVMRGISMQAVKNNTPVLAAPEKAISEGGLEGDGLWRAQDIALQNEPCSWMQECFMRVNESTEGGQAFFRSLYSQYASWGVDFIKHDCIFGTDLNVDEIRAVSEAIIETGRPMIYSISPGVLTTLDMALKVNGLVNMYRVTGDDWDSWMDLQSHFDVARDFVSAGLINSSGLHGFSWPDLDMLPLGYLTDPDANQGPHRFCQLTYEEQKTQMTLWAMAKSPLMFGGDLLNLDQTTLDLLTNLRVLDINSLSVDNMEIQQVDSTSSGIHPVLDVLGCADSLSTRWSLRNVTHLGDIMQLCYNFQPGISGPMGVEDFHTGCLYWESFHPSQFSNGKYYTKGTRQKETFLGRASLANTKACLSSDVGETSNFTLFHSRHFSPCSLQTSQMWRLSPEGQLVSEATELCVAVIDDSDEKLHQNSKRIWRARGPLGQYYVAFFNLGPSSTLISVPLESIIQTSSVQLGIEQYRSTKDSKQYQCIGQEVWSSQDIRTVTNTLSAQVPSHGCALFDLKCDQQNSSMFKAEE